MARSEFVLNIGDDNVVLTRFVNGKVAKGWPAKGSNGVSWYKYRGEVEELIRFVESGSLVKFLEALGTQVDQDAILDAVGMP